jgi:hypothetical protein
VVASATRAFERKGHSSSLAGLSNRHHIVALRTDAAGWEETGYCSAKHPLHDAEVAGGRGSCSKRSRCVLIAVIAVVAENGMVEPGSTDAVEGERVGAASLGLARTFSSQSILHSQNTRP